MTFTNFLKMKYGMDVEEFEKTFQPLTKEEIKHLWEQDYKSIQSE